MPSYIPQPTSFFTISNVDGDPNLVHLAWKPTTDDDLRQDYLLSDDMNNPPEMVSASAGGNPEFISAHLRKMVGYRLHRGLVPTFIPDVSNELANESTLGPYQNEYEDTNVIDGVTYYYKLRQVVTT